MRCLFTLGMLLSISASAQSFPLLESLRVHDDRALQMAQDELATCDRNHCPEMAQLSLLVGVLELSGGDANDALLKLTVQAPMGPLAPYARYYEGEARFYQFDFKGAAEAFDHAAEEGPAGLQRRANARKAEALLLAGETSAAETVLDSIAEEWPTPELLLARGRVKALLGKTSEASMDFRALVIRHANTAAATEANEELQRLPKELTHLSLDERITRARTFIDSGNLALGQAELDLISQEKLVKKATESARVALLHEGLLFAQGQDEKADAFYKKALTGAPAIAAEASLLKAKRLMRGPGLHPEAQKLMAEISKRWPKETSADEAAYLSSWMLTQAGQYLPAAQAFATYGSHHPHSHHHDEAVWFRGYSLIRAERYADARAVFDGLIHSSPRSPFVPQAKYWSARCQQMVGEKDVSAIYEDLIHQFPGNFYAYLATERLLEFGRAPPEPFPSLNKSETSKGEMPELALAQALSRSGLLWDAAEEIQRRAATVRTSEGALQLGTALARLMEHGTAYGMAARVLWAEAFTRKSPSALALFFPRAFGDVLEREARDRGLKPYLLWSIMRRESAFRPNLLSAANARGLMQLIPATATSITKALKEDNHPPDALYSPSINLHLATWYVAQLWRRFSHPVLVSAAYNAGPAATLRWVKDNGQLPVDLFVEAIPYKETRIYVKQVVADLYNYEVLYGPPKDRDILPMHIPAPRADGIDF